jgi:hypothetical protein
MSVVKSKRERKRKELKEKANFGSRESAFVNLEKGGK